MDRASKDLKLANGLGIPCLEPEQGSLSFEGESSIWRTVSSKKKPGIWLFYADDYRLEPIWRDPYKVPATGARHAAELNFSVFEDSPAALAIWNVYRKRCVSKIWQDYGIKVWIDLCFPGAWERFVLLGVPKGWQRYATRGFEARVDDLERELGWARRHADGNPFRLLVYGGGSKVLAWTRGRNDVLYVPHYSSGRKRLGQGTRRRLKRLACGSL